MDVRRVRAAGASLVTVALMGLAASPALAAPGVSVSAVSSLKAGATAGTLTGKVVNDTGNARRAARSRCGSCAAARSARRRSAARRSRSPRTAPPTTASPSSCRRGLTKGNYYLSACTSYGTGGGAARLRHGAGRRADQGRHPGPRHAGRHRAAPRPRRPRVCSAGGRTLAKPGSRLYPETGNTGYSSVHTDVNLIYDAPTNLFLPGTHVDLAAARDAVPDRVQPRLRAHERVHQHRRPGPEPDRRSRSRSTASRRPSRSSSRPTRATRTARTIPTRWRTPRRTPTRSARPTRTRPPARRSATPPRSRACSAPRTSS